TALLAGGRDRAWLVPPAGLRLRRPAAHSGERLRPDTTHLRHSEPRLPPAEGGVRCPGPRLTPRRRGSGQLPGLVGRPGAGPDLGLGAGRGGPAGVVQALARRLQAAVAAHGPLLGVGAVAGVDLDRVEVGRAGAPVVQAQAAVPGDRAGRRGRPATAAAARAAAGATAPGD